jgi:hypothetical protein
MGVESAILEIEDYMFRIVRLVAKQAWSVDVTERLYLQYRPFWKRSGLGLGSH